MSSHRAFGLKNLYRRDGTPVTVVLTTVPPLGLAASDPREQVREQLDNDIRTNYTSYGADTEVDFDAAVAGSTTGQLNATMVTNGSPNAAYYTALATALFNAITTFPPTAPW